MGSARDLADDILAGIEGINVDASTKEKFKNLVGAVLTAQGHDWHERGRRIAFARDLLRMRVPRPLVRERLMAAFGISRPQAYRAISEALQLSHE